MKIDWKKIRFDGKGTFRIGEADTSIPALYDDKKDYEKKIGQARRAARYPCVRVGVSLAFAEISVRNPNPDTRARFIWLVYLSNLKVVRRSQQALSTFRFGIRAASGKRRNNADGPIFPTLERKEDVETRR
jgi:hypothetical protein